MAARTVRVTLLLAAGAAVAQTAVGVVNGIVLDHRFRSLDPDREHTVFAWASSVTCFAAAFAALILAIHAHRVRRWAVALASLLAFFSLDDLLAIHEPLVRSLFVDRLGLPLGIGGRMSAVLYLPLLVTAVVALAVCGRRAPHAVRLGIVGGLACLGLAVVLELVNGALQSAGVIRFRQPADVVVATAEEGLELAGLGLIAGSLAALALAAVLAHGFSAGTEPAGPGRP